jgi:type I restriction enzyme M protein
LNDSSPLLEPLKSTALLGSEHEASQSLPLVKSASVIRPPVGSPSVLILPVSAPSVLLTCPIRGPLNASALASDNLTPTEEARRIDFLRYLLMRDYPAANIAVETVVIAALGEKGRNKLRADVIVYDKPVADLASSSLAEKLEHALLVAEIKRESNNKKSGIQHQLIPAMQVMPSMTILGVYWDDISQLLFHKHVVKENGQENVRIGEDVLANLPQFGQKYRSKPITVSTLVPAENLVATLQSIANVMRSNSATKKL